MKYYTMKDTREFLPKAAVPALFCHGTADRTVPLSQGLKNYEACACEKEKYIVQGAGHTLCYLYGGKEAAFQLDQFIQKYFTVKERNEP